jgi:hypothetical protein
MAALASCLAGATDNTADVSVNSLVHIPLPALQVSQAVINFMRLIAIKFHRILPGVA